MIVDVSQSSYPETVTIALFGDAYHLLYCAVGYHGKFGNIKCCMLKVVLGHSLNLQLLPMLFLKLIGPLNFGSPIFV